MTDNRILARYLTLAGAALADREITVDIDDRVHAKCRGCGDEWGTNGSASAAKDWANEHAQQCRALPTQSR